MNDRSDAFDKLQALFESVCDLAAGEQAARLEAIRRETPTMHAALMRMLAIDAGDEDASSRLGAIVREELLSEPRDASAEMPSAVGSFRVVRRIGEGGMGVVYEAHQDQPQRRVALKLIRAGLASAETLRRFEYEAHVLGLLHHPGIAQIHEAGTADTGAGPQPYFAMELIEGRPLLDYVRQERPSVADRLRLVAELCDAIQHAHTRGVVHRDLKPGNILIDGEGQAKIVDFGVARVTDKEIRTTTLQTAMGQIVGTVPYMSPEQASGDPDAVDTRSDIHALGVIMYELLSGDLPYDIADKLVHEAIRIVREEEPSRLGTHDRSLRGDIETIAATALAKDVDRRYQTASAFADDIRRYIANEPIQARPASGWYRFRKFAVRNKGLVAGVSAAALALILGAAGTTWGFVLADQRAGEVQEQLAEAQAAHASIQAVLQFFENVAVHFRVEAEQDVMLGDVLDEAARQLESNILEGRERAEVHAFIATGYSALDRHDEAQRHAEVGATFFPATSVGVDDYLARKDWIVGTALMTQGRLEEARSTLRDAISFQLKQGAAQAAPAALELARLEQRFGDPQAGIRVCDELFSDWPNAILEAPPQFISMYASCLSTASRAGEAVSLLMDLDAARTMRFGPTYYERDSVLLALISAANARRQVYLAQATRFLLSEYFEMSGGSDYPFAREMFRAYVAGSHWVGDCDIAEANIHTAIATAREDHGEDSYQYAHLDFVRGLLLDDDYQAERWVKVAYEEYAFILTHLSEDEPPAARRKMQLLGALYQLSGAWEVTDDGRWFVVGQR